jgi:hypothetical protein
MKKIETNEFNNLLRNTNSISKIVPNGNSWFFTINFFATELSTGIGLNDTKYYNQTWELVEAVPEGFKFMMWGEAPAPHNGFTNTLNHEGKNLIVGITDVINLLKWLCLSDFKNFHGSNFEIKNLRNCQGISSFFNTKEEFTKEHIENIIKYNGQRVLFELLFPEYFQFPVNTLKNDFSKVLNLHKNEMSLIKRFAGNLTTSSNEIKIENNSVDFPADYEFEKDFKLTITQTKSCLLIKYFDKKSEQIFEIPINSFQLIT